MTRPDRGSLTARYAFALDRFQIEAFDHLDAGESVIVAAPTGSGKTVVAEYGMASALADGRRAFYTAPIKALSNQKYRDLCAVHGVAAVGLVTGDNVVNPDAPLVVMTTEVLRNMVYSGSRSLDDLDLVVLDEVHFIQDAYRGPVWEEVIVHLPRRVRLVCLSATVSNADEIAEWMTIVRGPTKSVTENKRPVPLEPLFMVGDRSSDVDHLLPVFVDGRANPAIDRLLDRRTARRGRPRRAFRTPSRIDVVERLRDEDLLPAIHFIFSRNQCDEAAVTCARAGFRFTSVDERRRIREILDDRTRDLDDDDLHTLGIDAFAERLEAGIAAHHAGMIPPFKEAVEACFSAGLLRVVFATETLAVGINMPARTVVIEKLSKFTGEHHQGLTAGEFTQLTGRAGRRGIDAHGSAVVLWNPFVTFAQVAGLAASRSFRLGSSFRPTYNMASNLIASYTAEEARHLLNLSLAQFQSDREIVRTEARLEERQREFVRLQAEAESPYGDLHEFRSAETPAGRSDSAVEFALSRLRPGDVVVLHNSKVDGRAVVITSAQRAAGAKITVVTPGRAVVNLAERDFEIPPRARGRVELPEPYAPGRPEFHRAVAALIDAVELSESTPAASGTSQVVGVVRHPVEDDPDLEERLRAAARADRVAAEIDVLRRRVRQGGDSVARRFERVLGILAERGFVEGWSLTDKGRTLAGTFHECDLLVAEVLHRKVLDGLDAIELAGLASCLVYEHRSSEPPPAAWFPSAEVRRRFRRMIALSDEIRTVEEKNGLSLHRRPDPTFLAVAHAWAAGESFGTVVDAEEISGGDFVRTMKQLVDLLRQIASVAPEADSRVAAETAVSLLDRGVVRASSGLDRP